MSNNKSFEIINNYSRKDTTQVEKLDNIFKTKDKEDTENIRSKRSKLLSFYMLWM